MTQIERSFYLPKLNNEFMLAVIWFAGIVTARLNIFLLLVSFPQINNPSYSGLFNTQKCDEVLSIKAVNTKVSYSR